MFLKPGLSFVLIQLKIVLIKNIFIKIPSKRQDKKKTNSLNAETCSDDIVSVQFSGITSQH